MNVYLIKTNFRFCEINIFNNLRKKNNSNKYFHSFLKNNKNILKFSKFNFDRDKKFLNDFKLKRNFCNMDKNKGDSEFNIELINKDKDDELSISKINLNNFYLQMKEEQQKDENNLPTSVSNKENMVEEVFEPDRNLSTSENFRLYREHINKKEYIQNQKINYKKRVGICMFIMFIGLFTLWIPFYKVICESQGFSVKTTHQDYKFDGRKRKLKIKIYLKFSECYEKVYSKIHRRNRLRIALGF